jgi:hypothetical protein
MRKIPSLALIVLLLPVRPAIQANTSSLGQQLEELAPRAAGVAQVEVVDIKEVNETAGDGPMYLDVRFRILRGTGTTTEGIHIIEAQGGLGPPDSPEFKPHGPVKVGTFRKGSRYWVAFSSQYDWERCPQGVVASWPDKDGPKLLEEAIRTDHYAHRPQYDPRSGLTHSYRVDSDRGSWWVRMERDGALLWETRLPGEKFKGERYDGEWRLVDRQQWPSGLEHADDNRSGWFLFAETASRLEVNNGYRLPAEKHRLTYVLDAESGKTAAIWVSLLDKAPTASPSIVQYLDLQTGGIRREELYDFLESGGMAAGAKEERWLRKIVRTLDPDTRRLKQEDVFRWTESPNGSQYVAVNK